MARNLKFESISLQQTVMQNHRFLSDEALRPRPNRGRVRITAQLTDTASGVHIWTDRFDGNPRRCLRLAGPGGASDAGVIEPTLRKVAFERVSRKPTR